MASVDFCTEQKTRLKAANRKSPPLADSSFYRGAAGGRAAHQALARFARQFDGRPARFVSVLFFVLEGDLDLGAEGFDPAAFNHHVLLDHLGHTQIPEALGGALDGRLCGLLP
jgi:hypothetical protein